MPAGPSLNHLVDERKSSHRTPTAGIQRHQRAAAPGPHWDVDTGPPISTALPARSVPRLDLADYLWRRERDVKPRYRFWLVCSISTAVHYIVRPSPVST